MFRIKKKLNINTAVLLAETEGSQIIGSAVVTLENGNATLDTIQTNLNKRGQGVGGALLKEAENFAQSNGASQITGKYYPDTTQPTQKVGDWYTSKGYTVSGETVSKKLR